MSTRIVELLPKEILVSQNGNQDTSNSADCLLVVKWVRPSELTPLALGEIPKLSIKGGKKVTHFPTDSAANLLTNQLIKTKVIGRSAITVELIAVRKAGLLNKVIAALFEAAVGTIGITNPYASALVLLAKSQISENIKKDELTSLGQGAALCDADNLPEEIKIELKPTKPITVHDNSSPFLDPDSDATIVEVLGAGKVNGSVVLTLNALE